MMNRISTIELLVKGRFFRVAITHVQISVDLDATCSTHARDRPIPRMSWTSGIKNNLLSLGLNELTMVFIVRF